MKQIKTRNIVKLIFTPPKTQVGKVINYGITALIIVYLLLLLFPSPCFRYTYQSENIKLYSTLPISDSANIVLARALNILNASPINDKTIMHNLYLCNSFSLYTFFAPTSRTAFAVNRINTIFIALCNIGKDVAYKNNKNDGSRQL